MKPAPFVYFRPRTLDEALALLAEHGDAKPLAGGQSLIPAMNFRLAMPAALIDLNALDELSYITEDSGGGLRVGAMTRHRIVECSDVVRRAASLLHETMPSIAHPAIRTRGTIGGSLAHADPAAELPAVMLALDAHIGVQSRQGARQVPAIDFFTGLFSTALVPGELITDILIPAVRDPGSRRGSAFLEFSRRRGDFALAGVAASIAIDDRGRCAAARIALLSVGDRPLLATEAAKALVGEMPSTEVLRAAAAIAAEREIDPSTDIHASSRYRRQLASVLTRRALERAFTRAEASQESRP
jgi:carbon-monoxide dehydrogenase medium subunit